MALSDKFISLHITTWEKNLSGPAYPHRAKWPSRLFHHAPLENDANILKSAKLLSRNDSNNIRVRDVAAASVIDNNLRAHKFVRLYFRPRTPTQYYIEGIQKAGECHYGDTSHAPVLIMFVLDAKKSSVDPRNLLFRR
jgi:ssDNA thymidine ADP-ribosyltransferase, DarT